MGKPNRFRDLLTETLFITLSSFGALNEVAIALDETNRKYRKGIPIEFMQGKIASAIAGYMGFLTFLIDETDNIRRTLMHS